MKRLILSRMFELDFFLLTLWAVELWLWNPALAAIKHIVISPHLINNAIIERHCISAGRMQRKTTCVMCRSGETLLKFLHISVICLKPSNFNVHDVIIQRQWQGETCFIIICKLYLKNISGVVCLL
jgi:hypothetical protein